MPRRPVTDRVPTARGRARAPIMISTVPDHRRRLLDQEADRPASAVAEDGAAVATAAGVRRVPARRITPIDTTAAGNRFFGVLAAAPDHNALLGAALVRASAAAYHEAAQAAD